jgi:Mrp family chromosome partitioning ATPase
MEQGASAGETQFALVAGVGDGLAQPAAVELARRLAREADAVLLDIGAIWPGVAEILHAGGEASFVGVSDVLAGEASLEAALHRDPAGRLDVVPLGEIRAPIADGLDEALLALAESYEHVVIHASNWREEAALVVAALIHAMVVVAPAKGAASEIAEARAEFGAAVEVLALRVDKRAEVNRAA